MDNFTGYGIWIFLSLYNMDILDILEQIKNKRKGRGYIINWIWKNMYIVKG